MSDNEFGVWLAGKRRELRASLNDVARHAGVSGQTISNAEDGQHVRPETRDAIEDAIMKMEALRVAEQSSQWTRQVTDDVAALRERVEQIERLLVDLRRSLPGPPGGGAPRRPRRRDPSDSATL